MNKKLIAIAIASVMAAPVAMADVKLSGVVGLEFTAVSVDGALADPREFGDTGQTRLQFDATQGDAYARLAYNDTNRDRDTMRDTYVGYKFGSTSVQAGRMAGVAKNLEKDPYIATFLQVRGTPGASRTSGEYGSSSFVDDIVQLSMKVGAGNFKVQFGAEENSGANDGHIGVSYTGKGAGINYFVSYNNGVADADSSAPTPPSASNMKLGGNMKFGSVKVGLMYTAMDTGVTNAATDSIFVDANMALGNGLSANLGLGVKSADAAANEATYMRLAVMKKLNKGAKVYAGYTSTDNDVAGAADSSEIGVGMVVKF